MRFKAKVYETRQYLVEYEIEADNPDDAYQKAREGETENEEKLEFIQVDDRFVQSVTPVEVKPGFFSFSAKKS